MTRDQQCVMIQAGDGTDVASRSAAKLKGRLLAAVFDWQSLEDLCRAASPHLIVMSLPFLRQVDEAPVSSVKRLIGAEGSREEAEGSGTQIAVWTREEERDLRDVEALEAVIGCYVIPRDWARLEAELDSWWRYRLRRDVEASERISVHHHARQASHQRHAAGGNGRLRHEAHGYPETSSVESSNTSAGYRNQREHDYRLHTRPGTDPGHPETRPQVMPRQLIAVVSPKGGVGKTFVAVNLAVGLAEYTPFRTLLVDLDLTSSDSAVHLDMLDATGLIDVLPHVHDLKRRGLGGFVSRDPHSGLDVLCGPDAPELAELVTEAHLDAVLGQAVKEYPFVIVDTGPDIGHPAVRLLLREASTALVVTAPEATSLRHARQLLERLSDEGLPPKVMTVVNGLHGQSPVNLRGIRRFLDHDITAAIEHAAGEVEASIFNGRPLVLHQPDAVPVPGLRRLLEAVYPMDYDGGGTLAGRVRRWSQRLVTQWLGRPEPGTSGGVSIGL